ncbi:hypothetical protein FQZ97_773190 [compost metagenome]
MDTEPISPCATRLADNAAVCACSSKACASMKNARPAAVNATERVLRVSSVTPRLCSSNWICRLSGGWVMFRRSAARRKFSSVATVVKQRSWASSNIDSIQVSI